MRIVWLSPSDMLTEWMIGSLESLSLGHELSVLRYDKIGLPVDRGMLDHVDCLKPDLILYISQAGGPFCASPDTFRRLRDRAPIVHLCFDAYDIGFTEYLELYRKKDCFSLTVACDGGAAGPVDLISFHPVDPRPYQCALPLLERPISLGTCGGFPYGLRKNVMEHLQKRCGLLLKQREEVYGSYQRYATFYMLCQVILDCALSAGGYHGTGPYARTLKTRAIEVGLAGACLLELRGSALNRWATEDVDYATYETPEEAEHVYRSLMKDPERMVHMAANLNRIVRDKMSPAVFWGQVFGRLFSSPGLIGGVPVEGLDQSLPETVSG